ncbi:MAG: hypothetical protein JWP92_2294 [Caulobacter sp.]|nr:hypothetical protein [Caulobacter sp.]
MTTPSSSSSPSVSIAKVAALPPVTGCATIDSTTPDGYLDNARVGIPTAGANATSAIAASNLLGCESPKTVKVTATIVGHGGPGVIAAGCGRTLGGPTTYIGLANQSTWQPSLATLNGQVSSLMLYGCNTGADQAGADLLYNIARIVNASVSAPTGWISCNAQGVFALQDGTGFQTATPTSKPTPIPKPSTGATLAVSNALLQVNGALVSVDLDDMASATYLAATTDGVTLTGPRALSLAKAVALDSPLTIPGALGSLVTGELKVTFKTSTGVLTKTFVVYEAALVQDSDEPELFYPVRAAFESLLKV